MKKGEGRLRLEKFLLKKSISPFSSFSSLEKVSLIFLIELLLTALND